MKLQRIKIRDLGKIVTGNTPPRKEPDYYGTAYPFIKPTDIELDTRFTYNPEECYSEKAFEKYKNSLIPEGSTCVVTIGSIGKKITMAHTNCFINQAMNAVIPYDNFDPYYVFYLLKHNLYKVKALDSGTSSGRENVSKSSFGGIEIDTFLSKNIQNRISKILGSYDDLIENNLERLQLLEDVARSHYRLLLQENNKDNKVKLGTIINWSKGKKPKEIITESSSEFLPYLVFDTLEETGRTFANPDNVPIARNEHILMCMDGARSGVVFRGQLGVLGSTFAAIQPIDLSYTEYLYQFLSESYRYIIQGNSGSAIPHANRDFINDIEVLVPNTNSLREYNTVVLPVVSQIRNLRKQNSLLREARDIILPRLINGEIDVTSMQNKHKPIAETI